MSSGRIVYAPGPDATPQSEVETLANVYAFILKCYQEKKGGPATAQNDPKEIKNDRDATRIVPE